MRTLIISALALMLCVVPVMAQPDFVDEDTPRPTDVAGQIKQDLQRLKQNFSSTNDSDVLNAAVYEARPGFFGASEWMRGFVKLLNGKSVSIDAVKVLERNKDDARAAVVYSFQPSPDEAKGARKISADPHQEILRFKLVSIPYEEPARKIWKIVPPATPPNELKSQIDLTERDDLFANVAYHLAQKQVPETIGTPVERSMDNLKLLGEGTFQLVEDYGEVYAFAPAYVTEALAIYTFTRNPAVFQVPDTNEIYAFNTNLSGLNLAAVNEVARTVLFYEGRNETPTFRYDGKAAICFADGHVALVSPEQAKDLIWKP